MIDHRVLRAAKHLNKDTLRLAAVLGGILAACAAVMSFLGALLMIRQLQLVSAQRKALPVLQQAAQLYLDQNGSVEAPVRRRRKLFRFPEVKQDETPEEPVLDEEPGDDEEYKF